jgi:hypothetical protein
MYIQSMHRYNKTVIEWVFRTIPNILSPSTHPITIYYIMSATCIRYCFVLTDVQHNELSIVYDQGGEYRSVYVTCPCSGHVVEAANSDFVVYPCLVHAVGENNSGCLGNAGGYNGNGLYIYVQGR